MLTGPGWTDSSQFFLFFAFLLLFTVLCMGCYSRSVIGYSKVQFLELHDLPLRTRIWKELGLSGPSAGDGPGQTGDGPQTF